MSFYFVIHNLPKNHSKYEVVTKRICSYEHFDIIQNVFLVATNTAADILTAEICGTKPTESDCSVIVTPLFDSKPDHHTPTTRIVWDAALEKWINDQVSNGITL